MSQCHTYPTNSKKLQSLINSGTSLEDNRSQWEHFLRLAHVRATLAPDVFDDFELALYSRSVEYRN